MALADVLRAGIAIADKVTKSVQVDVVVEAYLRQNGWGEREYADPITLKAVVDLGYKQRLTTSGRIVPTKAWVGFLVQVPPNGAEGRNEPIDQRDRLTLPGGVTGEIVESSGITDPSTSRPFFCEVWIGDAGAGQRA